MTLERGPINRLSESYETATKVVGLFLKSDVIKEKRLRGVGLLTAVAALTFVIAKSSLVSEESREKLVGRFINRLLRRTVGIHPEMVETEVRNAFGQRHHELSDRVKRDLEGIDF